MNKPDDLSFLTEKPFSDAVQKLEDLLAQNWRAFLIGAGCSKCAGLPLTAELTEKVLASNYLEDTAKEILTAIRDLFNGSSPAAHIEDFLSELIDLLALVNRRATRGATNRYIVLADKKYDESNLVQAAEQIKQAIVGVIEQPIFIHTHQRFIEALHRPSRPGKSLSGQSIDYLVLNYDTIIEDALALARVPFSDGMDGGVTGWWNPVMFDRKGLDARVFKLHGSINWHEFPDDPLPRRIASSVQLPSLNKRRVLIWPASTKYRETQFDPYAQLIERARKVLNSNGDSHRVLVICGYSFGDSHINIEIERALNDSAGNLTVIAFTHEDEPSGKLKYWHENSAISEQVLIF